MLVREVLRRTVKVVEKKYFDNLRGGHLENQVRDCQFGNQIKTCKLVKVSDNKFLLSVDPLRQ